MGGNAFNIGGEEHIEVTESKIVKRGTPRWEPSKNRELS